jgi:hypothetical protein
MQEPYGKAVAPRAGLEPWRCGGDAVTRASASFGVAQDVSGDRAAWVLSRERERGRRGVDAVDDLRGDVDVLGRIVDASERVCEGGGRSVVIALYPNFAGDCSDSRRRPARKRPLFLYFLGPVSVPVLPCSSGCPGAIAARVVRTQIRGISE